MLKLAPIIARLVCKAMAIGDRVGFTDFILVEDDESLVEGDWDFLSIVRLRRVVKQTTNKSSQRY